MGVLECDDGNTLDGDGCSSSCELEQGFACKAVPSGPDSCYTTIPPKPSLKIVGSKNEAVTLRFSRPILAPSSSITAMTLIKSMELKLLHAMKGCEPLYTFRTVTKSATGTFSQLTADLTIECSVTTNTKLKVTFSSPGLFRDENGIPMVETEATVRLNKASWLDAQTAQAISSAGSSFSSANLVILCASLAQYLLQSVALGSLWAFVNMAQIIYYTPVISTQIPANLKMFIANYMTISQIKIPISLDFIPTTWLETMKASLVDANFQDFGLTSFSFLYNFYQQLFTWVILLCFYISLSILNKLRPKNRFLFIRRWKREYEFNAVIRVLVECFLELTFYSLLNISYVDTSNPLITASCYFAAVGFALSIGFFIACTRLASHPRAVYSQPDFKQSYSSIMAEFRTDAGPFCRGYYVLFMLRRIIYALFLIALAWNVKVQLSMIIVLDILMLSYISMLRPFNTRLDNYLNSFNEGVILILHASLLAINVLELDGTPGGWACMGFIIASAVQTWSVMMYCMIKTAAAYVIKRCNKKRGESSSAVPLPHSKPKRTTQKKREKGRRALVETAPQKMARREKNVVTAHEWEEETVEENAGKWKKGDGDKEAHRRKTARRAKHPRIVVTEAAQ